MAGGYRISEGVGYCEEGKEMSDPFDLDMVLSAVDNEPELPGPMPDDIWNRMRTKEEATEILRMAVRATKRNIRERIIKFSTPSS